MIARFFKVIPIFGTLLILGGNPVLGQQPVKVIFDTDMGSDCDDVGALALLHAYTDMEEAEVIACIYSSGKIRYGVGIIDAINTYYHRPDIPIGADHGNEVGDPVDKMGAEKLAAKQDLYGHSVVTNDDVPDQSLLLRQLLAEQPDGSVVYLTVGHTKGLYDLMNSEPDQYSPLNGKQLINRKLIRWIALGALSAHDGGKDWNFYFNGSAPYTKYLVENIPTDIYYISAGTDVMTGASLASLSKGTIVRDAYESWLSWYDGRTLADQRPSWDLVGVYYAIKGEGDFLKNTGEGNLAFDVENGCLWQPGVRKGPKQYYIEQKPGTDKSFADYLNALISKQPGLTDY